LNFQVLETVGFEEVLETTVPKSSAIKIVLRNGGRLELHTHRAPQIHTMIHKYIVESEKVSHFYTK